MASHQKINQYHGHRHRQDAQRELLWSATCHLTRERVYSDRAKRELLSLASLPD